MGCVALGDAGKNAAQISATKICARFQRQTGKIGMVSHQREDILFEVLHLSVLRNIPHRGMTGMCR